MEGSAALAMDTHACSNNRQGSLFNYDALGESKLIHSDEKFGFFSLLTKKDGRGFQRSFKLTDMAKVLPLLPLDRDTYISQAEFILPNRRVVNLARVGLLFVDLDCYDLDPAKAMSKLFWTCDENNIPHPSIVIFSGRGLQAKWILETPQPRYALPRWNAVQAALVNTFINIGGDHQARDASRVLRLVGTTNSKSNERVVVLHVNHDKAMQPKVFSFEYMAEILLPYGRDYQVHNDHPFTLEEQDAIAKKREDREAKSKANPGLILIQGTSTNGLHRFSGRQLAWHRMEDIRKLTAMRGGVKQGLSMPTLFWCLNFLLLSGATNSSQMFHEAKTLAREFGFGELNRQDELSTLYVKAKDFEAGKSIKLKGKVYPALYTPKNATLIDIFEITDEEQKQLRTIISKDEAKDRDATRKRKMRHNAGSISRNTYLSSYNDKRIKALEMSKEGLSNRTIAKELEINKTTIGRWLKKWGVAGPSVLLGGVA